jgi:hypothetical protein
MATEQSPIQPPSPAPLFAPKKPERSTLPLIPLGVAGLLILLVVGAILLTSHHKSAPSNSVLAPDPYATSLTFSQIQMSESSSLSGGKVTYIDGHVRNTGPRTVTAVSLQVLFANDIQQPPQIEPVPMNLIRTHEPYIDTEPVSAAPLAPGDDHEFRLAFEDIDPNWNQQLPQIVATHIATK